MSKKLTNAFYGAVILIMTCAVAFCVHLRIQARDEIHIPEPESTAAPAVDYSGLLRISELMSKNRATVADENGAFCDWVELENCSGQTVDLTGWYLSDREGSLKWAFPSGSIAPGEYLTVFCGGKGSMSADFSLSGGETVYLIAPSGQTVSSVLCSADKAGLALALGEDGVFHETRWATPGYPNTRQGYEAFCSAAAATGPVVINEAMSANSLYAIQPGLEAEDWVELKNISDAPVELAGCHLSDSHSDYALWALPEHTLQPGETLLIYCSGNEANSAPGYTHASFSLDAVEEALYLTDSGGQLMDYVHLHDIPPNGSMGRMDGEKGFFYCAAPTPNRENSGGARFVSEAPRAVTADGVYNDVESLAVELSAPGEIHYTTDGTVPTAESSLYTGPVTLSATGVLRAVALEEGGLMSPVVTYSYIINENHTLPVLSIVVDDKKGFNSIYNAGKKYVEIPANAALYDGESSFNHRCSVSMKGWTSLKLAKKSLGINFGGIYGGDLDCDVFGNGITRYGSLSVRAGQDYSTSIFRNELFEELALEMSDKVYTQYSKFCILYLNGEYRGIYCLKEDFSRQYYASRNGVSKDSVTTFRTPATIDTAFFTEIVQFVRQNSLTDEENYQYICDRVDIDSLIDWFIIEGYSANTDLQGNARVFRSTETGNKWAFAAYDFDWAFYYGKSDFTIIFRQIGNAGNQIPPLITKLLQHPDFRQRFLARFSELNKTVLSNEHVLAKIDELQALLEPEVPRERRRWGYTLNSWYTQVDKMRKFITDSDWANHNIDQLSILMKLTDEELSTYFGR